MLNRKEYNAAFKTDLTEEQFDEIMGNPVSDISDIEELVLADKNGNAWYFIPKEKAISIEWLKDWNKKNGDNWNLGYTIDYIIKEWEKENEID